MKFAEMTSALTDEQRLHFRELMSHNDLLR
jgi:hypothetical protein